MRLERVKGGDVVQCNVRGREFFAVVTRTVGRCIEVEPITSGITYRTATAREVIAHYSKRRGNA